MHARSVYSLLYDMSLSVIFILGLVFGSPYCFVFCVLHVTNYQSTYTTSVLLPSFAEASSRKGTYVRTHVCKDKLTVTAPSYSPHTHVHTHTYTHTHTHAHTHARTHTHYVPSLPSQHEVQCMTRADHLWSVYVHLYSLSCMPLCAGTTAAFPSAQHFDSGYGSQMHTRPRCVHHHTLSDASMCMYCRMHE